MFTTKWNKICNSLGSKQSRIPIKKHKNVYFDPDLNYIILEILQCYSEGVAIGKQIYLAWIKAHVGIPVNEKVDSLAKLAANSGNYLNCKVSGPDFIRMFKEIRIQFVFVFNGKTN